MKKHYYIGRIGNVKRGGYYAAACGYTGTNPDNFSLNEKFVICLHCKRYANQVPADPLGPVAELAREK